MVKKTQVHEGVRDGVEYRNSKYLESTRYYSRHLYVHQIWREKIEIQNTVILQRRTIFITALDF